MDKCGTSREVKKVTIKCGIDKMRILYFADRASLCNIFQMKPTSCTLFLSIFI